MLKTHIVQNGSEHLLIHFQFLHFQKCYFHIFKKMIFWTILTLLSKFLIFTLSKITLLKVYESNVTNRDILVEYATQNKNCYYAAAPDLNLK